MKMIFSLLPLPLLAIHYELAVYHDEKNSDKSYLNPNKQTVHIDEKEHQKYRL